MIASSPPCPLCASWGGLKFFEGRNGAFSDRPRNFFRCGTCHLIFADATQFLSKQAEKAEYDLHQNSPQDMGYRRFLGRLFEPMQARIGAGSRGLDFGSGPGPTLSVMFEEAGYSMALYDPLYAANTAVLNQVYDFVVATEVVEHLHHPWEDLTRVWNCLKPGGILGIMTKLARDQAAFTTWHYKDDLTHVCFFSRETFQWLSDRWQAQLTFIGNDVILLEKSSP